MDVGRRHDGLLSRRGRLRRRVRPGRAKRAHPPADDGLGKLPGDGGWDVASSWRSSRR
ncbi:hypothetical protein GLA29479_5188 [Lysobacter antibioticus]|uniref:Uncharacterized protein n=1 Tax=Lysobacter antibioticus TaxID=84531 RepID=A0A0S2FH88_LYSAN|nr:hypothetical protein GLA29479_5188 [Lysobacter antibioticus]ALN82901.1 hypothetical protein LA76x_4799 [Lysobacter antibioticus]